MYLSFEAARQKYLCAYTYSAEAMTVVFSPSPFALFLALGLAKIHKKHPLRDLKQIQVGFYEIGLY